MGRYNTNVILTERIKKIVLGKVKTLVEDGSVRGFYPKLMYEQQAILCFQDLRTIQVGEQYTSLRGHGHIRKFFHTECYQRLFH